MLRKSRINKLQREEVPSSSCRSAAHSHLCPAASAGNPTERFQPWSSKAAAPRRKLHRQLQSGASLQAWRRRTSDQADWVLVVRSGSCALLHAQRVRSGCWLQTEVMMQILRLLHRGQRVVRAHVCGLSLVSKSVRPVANSQSDRV